MDTLNVAIFIVCDKLNLTWKKPIPMIKSKVYELNQMFNLKFYEEENQLGVTVGHNFLGMSL